MAVTRESFRWCMVLALFFGFGAVHEAQGAESRLLNTVDRDVLRVENTALHTPELRNLHTDEWPLTDVEFRFWAVYCCGYVLSVRRTSGRWNWTVHELRDPEIGYELIDRGNGPEAEQLWKAVQRNGVLELTGDANQRDVICVGCGHRVVQLRIDGAYIAASSPMDDHSEVARSFPDDVIIDDISERVRDFIDLHVDFPPYPEDEEG